MKQSLFGDVKGCSFGDVKGCSFEGKPVEMYMIHYIIFWKASFKSFLQTVTNQYLRFVFEVNYLIPFSFWFVFPVCYFFLVGRKASVTHRNTLQSLQSS